MSTLSTGTAMASLVSSLADNKAALGRRYADWAVSAPTLESAVAAAAMAQDELGHARSTYPVLKALGTETDEVSGGDRRMALLDSDLPDWNAFIAANLLVDGVLTTFVAACVGSSVEQMAARAKKILQEEGSHRVHGEAWAKRLARDPAQRDKFVARLEETWAEASRWLGPDDDAAYAAALEAGEVKQTAAHQRALIRDWLTAILAGEGVSISLPDPADWSSWDPERRRWTP
jgi:1,2-phenylacetyl-CoA epoxidase catalytic subunit